LRKIQFTITCWNSQYNTHSFCKRKSVTYKKFSWCWQTARLNCVEISQCCQTWYHSIC